MNNKQWKKVSHLSLNVLTVIIVLIGMLPMVWLFLTAIKPKIIAFAIPPVYVFKPTLMNFINIFSESDFIRSYYNSLIIACLTTIVSLYFGTLSGYSLARSSSRLSRAMGIWIILTRMASPIMFILPLYLTLRNLNLLDSYLGLALTYQIITLPFVTWLMTGFFKGVPVEIEEAAFLDGCGRVKSLFVINLPLVLPGVVTCAIFTFIMAWNEFLYALVISGRNTRTAPIMVQGFVTFEGVNWSDLAAVGVFVTLPVIIISFIFQKGLIRGLTGGAFK